MQDTDKTTTDNNLKLLKDGIKKQLESFPMFGEGKLEFICERDESGKIHIKKVPLPGDLKTEKGDLITISAKTEFHTLLIPDPELDSDDFEGPVNRLVLDIEEAARAFRSLSSLPIPKLNSEDELWSINGFHFRASITTGASSFNGLRIDFNAAFIH